MSSNYHYISDSSKIPDIFKQIRSSGVPKKFTYRFFASLGFPSTNDRGFVKLFKEMGFIDEKGRPTSLYSRLLDTNEAKNVLGKCVREYYSELFTVSPEIYKKGVEEVSRVISRLNSVEIKEAKSMAETFLALCDVAFVNGVLDDGLYRFKDSRKDIGNSTDVQSPSKPAVSYNININIPETDDPRVLDAILGRIRDLLR